MEKRAVIITDHSRKDNYSTWESLFSDAFIIAVDGGADLLHSLSVLPDLIIGDMDSISPSVQAELSKQEIPIIKLNQAKDETDLEAAILYAHQNHYQSITIINHMQQRFDHSYGVLKSMEYATQLGLETCIETENQKLWMAKPEEQLDIDVDSIISLLPLTEQVIGVETEGLQYPLCKETLYAVKSRGISNVIIQSPAYVRHKAGSLLIVHTKKDHNARKHEI